MPKWICPVPSNLLAHNLKRLRAAALLTQEELAHQLNVSTGAVACWERAKHSPFAAQWRGLAEHFGLTLEAFEQEMRKPAF